MGKTAVIIGNGSFPRTEYPRYLISRADYLLCCDGGFEAYLRHREACGGRLPDVIIGDMDSLSSAKQVKYANLIVREDEQETNDQTKAFRYIMEHFTDADEIVIIAGTGRREDHTIGNISLLMEYARSYDLDARGIRVEMVSDHSTIFAITDSTEIQCGTGRSISIISPDNSLSIKSQGLEWPTDEVHFDNWWKATLNRAKEDTVRLVFNHKSIAIIIMN